VLTAQDDTAGQLDDRLLLNRATELDRVLVSQDADMLREGTQLLESGEEFSGIVYGHRLQITIGQMVEDLALIAQVTTKEEWRGKIEFLPIA
jgi:hypothetical protein